MTDTTLTKALHTVHYVNAEGKQASATPHDKPFKLDTKTFDELAGLGAVRKATKADADDAGDEIVTTEDPGVNLQAREYSVEEVAAFAPKHKGGGKFVVVLGDELVSTGDDGKGFDGKEAAEAWIVEARTKAGVTDDLLG